MPGWAARALPRRRSSATWPSRLSRLSFLPWWAHQFPDVYPAVGDLRFTRATFPGNGFTRVRFCSSAWARHQLTLNWRSFSNFWLSLLLQCFPGAPERIAGGWRRAAQLPREWLRSSFLSLQIGSGAEDGWPSWASIFRLARGFWMPAALGRYTCLAA